MENSNIVLLLSWLFSTGIGAGVTYLALQKVIENTMKDKLDKIETVVDDKFKSVWCAIDNVKSSVKNDCVSKDVFCMVQQDYISKDVYYVYQSHTNESIKEVKQSLNEMFDFLRELAKNGLHK